MSLLQFLSGTAIFCGALFVVLAIPLIKRRVKMNAIYGVRFKKSFESEDNWYAINEYGGRLLRLNGIVLIIMGVLGVWAPETTTGIVLMSCAPLTVLITCIATYRFATQL